MKAVKHTIYVGREMSDGEAAGAAISTKNIRWEKYKDEDGEVRSAYPIGLNSVSICQKFTERLFPDLTKVGAKVEKYEITIRKVK